jgi:hypothetical protein
MLPRPTAADVMPGGGLGLGGYSLGQAPPLLKGDRASPAEVSAEFTAGDRKPLQPASDAAVNSVYESHGSDLRNQKFGKADSVTWDAIFPQSGSAALGAKGGLLADGGIATLQGPTNSAALDIGNPRVGAPGALGTFAGGGRPTDDAEVALRAQILEAIKTDPATRLDQGVAIPALYQQVNPHAKLGFPDLGTRPQFPEDFARGRLELPKELRIDEQEAMLAPCAAYSHVGTLDELKDVYSRVYGGKPPDNPKTMATGSKAGMQAAGYTAETQALPGFYDMYPELSDPGQATHNTAGQQVAAPKAGEMPPLMAGDPAPSSQPDTEESGSGKWPINTPGYAIADAPRSVVPSGISPDAMFDSQ